VVTVWGESIVVSWQALARHVTRLITIFQDRTTRVSQYQNVSILDFSGARDDGGDLVMVTTGTIRRATLQSNPHHQQTNTNTRKAVCGVYKPYREEKNILNLLSKSHILGANIICGKKIPECQSQKGSACSSHSNPRLVTTVLLTYYQLSVSSCSRVLDKVLDPRKVWLEQL